MSEYWKSTPKYWCKFCSTYVRDTPLERRNHEATGKHQGSVQRSLRTIHKDHEQAEREKSRAKAEVERLNGVVAGGTTAGGKNLSSRDTGLRPGQSERTAQPKQGASVEERKRQMQQLAEMGIAVPEYFRKEMAMAGQWETTSTRRVTDTPLKQEDEDGRPNVEGLNVGVRKRRREGDDEEGEGTAGPRKRQGWGRDLREYPGGGAAGGEEDIEALLKEGNELELKPKVEEDEQHAVPHLKKEEGVEDTTGDSKSAPAKALDVSVKSEVPPAAPAVVFKKRKAKVTKT